MRTWAFAKRTTKEILRDPINIIFGLGFPIVILLLLTTIQKNIPATPFSLKQLTPGIAVFGLSFLSLFSATLISRDRMSSLLARLFTTPMTAKDYILGYTLPLIPMALIQTLLCYLAAFCLGLKITPDVIIAILCTIPISIIFIAIGLFCGTIFNDRQVGGICSALLTNLTAWLSGTWFSLDLIGGLFKDIAYCFPFVHAVDMARDGLNANYHAMPNNLFWVLSYAGLLLIAAVSLFKYKMKHN